MKRNYQKPEIKELHLLLLNFIAASPSGENTGYGIGEGEDPNDPTTPIGEPGGEGSAPSRYLRESMWDD